MTGLGYDYAIVGAGLAGCALAYELGRLGANVVVIDRGSIGSGSSSKNAGGVRQQFTQPTNIQVGRRTIERMLAFEAEMGIDPGFRQVGYLFLASAPDEADMFTRVSDVQRPFGVRTQFVRAAELQELVPGIRTDDLVGGLLSIDDGIVDPNSVVTGYAQGARKLGARIIEGQPVKHIHLRETRVAQLELGDGTRIKADTFVNAAGAWARPIARLAGVDAPVTPWRSQLFVLAASVSGQREMPLTVDWLHRKLVMHQEGPGLLVGCDNEEAGDPDVEPICDWTKLPEVASLVQHRMPRLESAGIVSGWAGYLEVTPDENPLVGKTDLDNFHLFAGFSGHGFSIVPGLVEDAARELAGMDPQLDLTPYRLDRFDRGATAPEAFSLR